MKKRPYIALVLLALLAGVTDRALALPPETPTATPSPTVSAGAPLNLQGACSFAVLGGAGIVRNGTSNITGDVGS